MTATEEEEPRARKGVGDCDGQFVANSCSHLKKMKSLFLSACLSCRGEAECTRGNLRSEQVGINRLAANSLEVGRMQLCSGVGRRDNAEVRSSM